MNGRWVWCPDGCRVVPEVPTAEMRSELRRVSLSHVEEMWKAGCNAAPEPPSGWTQIEDAMGVKEQGLCWAPSSALQVPYFIGYPDSGDWYTPLPPPPEEGR